MRVCYNRATHEKSHKLVHNLPCIVNLKDSMFLELLTLCFISSFAFIPKCSMDVSILVVGFSNIYFLVHVDVLGSKEFWYYLNCTALFLSHRKVKRVILSKCFGMSARGCCIRIIQGGEWGERPLWGRRRDWEGQSLSTWSVFIFGRYLSW